MLRAESRFITYIYIHAKTGKDELFQIY